MQLFPLHKVMKYFLGGGCCNSLKESESQILKGWQMVDAGNFLPSAINIYMNIALNVPVSICE